METKKLTADELLQKLRAKNPYWREYEELGKLLMKHIDDLTPVERKRYDELKVFVSKQEAILQT